MKQEIVHTLTYNFESFVNKTEEGVEFWLARDLQHLLGYSKWDNFQNVISKAKTACNLSGQDIQDHFADVGKMVDIGSKAQKEIDDIMLTRYACYLIAQNGDSSKEQIAFAQTYFAIQTRKAEIIEQRILEVERVQARHKLAETEKELSSVIYEQTGGNQNFAIIRSQGDRALFNKSTQHMTTENQISREHVTNNKSVRNTLLSRGIVPENLIPEEDVKKIERKLDSEKKKSLKNKEKLQ